MFKYINTNAVFSRGISFAKPWSITSSSGIGRIVIEKKYYETTKNIAVICTGLEHVTAE